MLTFTLTVEDGIATLTEQDADPNDMPIAEGFGATNDEAVAALFAQITLDGWDAPAPA